MYYMNNSFSHTMDYQKIHDTQSYFDLIKINLNINKLHFIVLFVLIILLFYLNVDSIRFEMEK